MDFTLDPHARSPLYRQLQDQIRYAISVGELRPGDRLPSIRELESRLAVNRNTVRRAYMELHADGTLLLRQGREAIVSPRPPAAGPICDDDLAGAAESLAGLMLQRAEAGGLDCLQFADYLAHAARAHDATYPRCAFVECSARQASYFAEVTGRRLGRRIVPIDLHDLGGDRGAMPASVRFVFTPHWHFAEAKALLESPARHVYALGVRITDECGRRLRALEGEHIGLVVRDPESAPGYRELLRQHMGRREIIAATADDREAIGAMMQRVDHVVYTPPCDEIVRETAPSHVGTHELIFEPTPEDLAAVQGRIFPALTRQAQPI